MPIGPIFPQGNSEDDEEVSGPPDIIEEAQELPLPDQSPAEEQPQPAASPEAKLPPEAQGEVNGGPLGCCLGVVAGLFFSLLIGVLGFGHNLAFLLSFVLPFSSITTVRIATACIAIAGAVVFGYFGWKIGKRLYREYEPPVIKDRTRGRKSKPKEA
jgi:hypothetical protein